MFGDVWYPVRDGNGAAVAMHRRHYPARGRNPRQFQAAGPGETLLLMTPCGRALFIWSLERYRQDGQAGVCCSCFRNEGAGLSSELILAAESDAWARWPQEERLFTFVDPAEVASPNPGYCFKRAGWRYAGRTAARGLHILEKTRSLGRTPFRDGAEDGDDQAREAIRAAARRMLEEEESE